MRRHAVIAERDRTVAAAARAPVAEARRERRARFIRAERLSPAECSALPATFDPGPEYDLDYIPARERTHPGAVRG